MIIEVAGVSLCEFKAERCRLIGCDGWNGVAALACFLRMWDGWFLVVFQVSTLDGLARAEALLLCYAIGATPI